MADTPKPAIYQTTPNLTLVEKISPTPPPMSEDLTKVYSALFSTLFLPEDVSNNPDVSTPSSANANLPATTTASNEYDVFTSVPYVYDETTGTYKRSTDQTAYLAIKEKNHYMVTDGSLGHFDVFHIEKRQDTFIFSLDHAGEKYVVTYTPGGDFVFKQGKTEIKDFVKKLTLADEGAIPQDTKSRLAERWEKVKQAIIHALESHTTVT